MKRKGITRTTLACCALLGVVLSIVARVIEPDPNGAVQSFDIWLYGSVALEVLSWSMAAIPAWFVARRVRALRTMTVPFQVVLWCYIAVLTFPALLCEAPYDYARSGQWWDYSSQNPLWAVIIALVTCSVWNIESDSMPSTVIVRLVLVIVAVVWSFAFQVLLSIVLFTLLLLVWPVDEKFTWKSISISRQTALIMTAVGTGITPLVSVWLIGHVSHSKNQGNQWLLWWAYPLVLVSAAVIRLTVNMI